MKKLILLFGWLFLFNNLSLKSQPLAAPDLQCVINDALNGNITLHWSTPSPDPCGTFASYQIFASINGGPYNLLTTLNQQNLDSFVHVGALGISQNWCYFMNTQYNCPGSTPIHSDTVCNTPPIVAQIQTVTVTENNEVIITWYPGISPQTHAYTVYYYQQSSGLAIPINTVVGRFDTTYTDNGANPSAQSLVYTIASLDSCQQISPFNLNFHNTIFLQTQTATCEANIQLNWNRYINWPMGVKEYRILANVNNSGYQQFGTVDSSTFTYNFTNFSDGDSVCIYVEAVSFEHDSIRSASNRSCSRPAIVAQPDYFYITNATVNLNDDIDVSWMIDPAAELYLYQVNYSGDNNAFGTVQFNVPSPLLAVDGYLDTIQNPQEKSFYYVITAVDSCQNEFNTPHVRTIHLMIEQYDQYTMHLSWNKFELFGSNVLRQNIYRDFGDGNLQLLATVDSNTTFYQDNLQSFLNQKGRFCYRIEAVYRIELPLANFLDTLSSFSNYVCVEHRPIMYVPNAFVPEGVNNVFKPTIIYGSPTDYSLIIFNRYGGQIFESNDPSIGWDGRVGGKIAQQGGYGYLIRFTAADGVLVERQGIVLLVRN